MYKITLPVDFRCGNNCRDKDGKEIVFPSKGYNCPRCGEMAK